MGAIAFGVLLAPHRNADGLAKALLGFKDLFLVGFFLSIGLKGLPGLDVLLVAALLVALVRLVEMHSAERRRRRPGSARGLITIADDFDAPLGDFREYT